MNVVYVFAEEVAREKAQTFGLLALTKEPHLLKLNNAIYWASKEEGPGEEPTHFFINTLSSQFTYRSPKLIYAGNRWLCFSALSDHGASGTLRGVEKFYILVDLAT